MNCFLTPLVPKRRVISTPSTLFFDIYQNSRFADFMIENGGRKVAIEIDDEASHNPKLVSQNKFYDDLLKQNSMIYLGWDVYRWAVRQMQQQPETVKDELRVFLGQHPSFKEIEDYLPTQRESLWMAPVWN